MHIGTTCCFLPHLDEPKRCWRWVLSVAYQDLSFLDEETDFIQDNSTMWVVDVQTTDLIFLHNLIGQQFGKKTTQ